MRALEFTFALLPLYSSSHAQTPAQEPTSPPQTSTLTVTTRLVSIDAVVRDAGSSPVQGLDQSAFTLREDGHAVPIRYFNRDSDLPLTVGLLIDTSGSELEYFSNELLSSTLFLEDVLRQPGAARHLTAPLSFALTPTFSFCSRSPPAFPRCATRSARSTTTPTPKSPRAEAARCSTTPSSRSAPKSSARKPAGALSSS